MQAAVSRMGGSIVRGVACGGFPQMLCLACPNGQHTQQALAFFEPWAICQRYIKLLQPRRLAEPMHRQAGGIERLSRGGRACCGAWGSKRPHPSTASAVARRRVTCNKRVGGAEPPEIPVTEEPPPKRRRNGRSIGLEKCERAVYHTSTWRPTTGGLRHQEQLTGGGRKRQGHAVG